MMAAYSLREKPRSMTNGAVIAPAKRVGELEQHDEGERRRTASSRERNSREGADRGLDDALQRTCRRHGAARRPWPIACGSVAISVVAMPISTSAAITA